MERIKEMKRFAITSLVFAVLIITMGLIFTSKDPSISSFLCICGGVLLAIGLTLLPKAIKLEKIHKKQENV
jgi:hypothetical protein